MNILRPATIWVENRCYRIISSLSTDISSAYVEEDAYSDVNIYNDEADCGIEDTIDFVVEELNNGKFQTTFPVASSYHSYIIGAKGATRRRIENDTYTVIKIPPKGQIGDIVVTGRDVKTVRLARIRLDLLVNDARRKQPFTHFVSIPFNRTSVQERFIQFKKEVLERCGDSRGVDESIFQAPEKLHLTLCVLVLADDRERHLAVDVLTKYQPIILSEHVSEEPICVEMRGVEYMNDDPGEVDVLYGKVSTKSWSHNLQNLGDSIVSHLVKAGVANKQYEKVKLHVTLMNTIFRQGDDADSQGKKCERQSFNGRTILEEFENYYFGDFEVSEIHLSVRHSTANNGYYSASTKLSLQPVSASK